jgi:hypothetical protein
MIAPSASTGRICIYCGGPATRLRKSEHILPEVIGGALTIKEMSGRVVCHTCNNRVLSQVDKELCCRSYLSIIASQERGAHLWQAWDVDHSSRNLLLEAKPSWVDGELSNLVCYPQIIFETAGPELRGDVEEANRFGRENFANVLVAAVRGAFQRYTARAKNGLHFDCVQSDLESRGYRLAPRVYTTHTITEIAKNRAKQSFILRYASPTDRKFALRSLSRLEEPRAFDRQAQRTGSRLPALAQFFDLGLTMRGLMKLGVNLIAAYCLKTPVNCEAFKKVIQVIRGDAHPDATLVAGNGFVHAADIECIKEPNQAHSFRIVYLDGEWVVYSSFFSGRIGSVVSFPGPNHEEWGTMDIVAPLEGKEWCVKQYRVIQPIKARVEWSDITRIAPSLKLQNAASAMRVEDARGK